MSLVRFLGRSTLACLIVLASCSDDREPVADPAPATELQETVSSTVPSSDGLDAWCAAARDVREATTAMDAVDPTDPAAVEQALGEMLARSEEALAVAPAEIADDVSSVFALVQELDRVLADADYDFLEADPADIVTDDGADEANARIAAFNADRCGFEPVDDVAGSTPVDRDALREQAIDVFVEQGFTAAEAACLFDNMDLDDPDLATDDEAMLELIQICDLDIERLAGTSGGDG